MFPVFLLLNFLSRFYFETTKMACKNLLGCLHHCASEVLQQWQLVSSKASLSVSE
jgi:hypothetical protein